MLAYGTADGGAAAIAWEDGIVLGFPIELVQGDAARSHLLAAALTHFGVEPDPDPTDDPDDDDEDDAPPAGCGCGPSSDSSGLLVLVVALALTRRRRA